MSDDAVDMTDDGILGVEQRDPYADAPRLDMTTLQDNPAAAAARAPKPEPKTEPKLPMLMLPDSGMAESKMDDDELSAAPPVAAPKWSDRVEDG